MKNLLTVFILLLSVTIFASNGVGKLSVGDKAVLTDFKMEAVSGAKVSINDANKKNGVLVLFSCNACPFVMRWEGRYNEIKEWADKNEVGMIVLNSNYRNRESIDSFEAMKKHASEKEYRFDYVVDFESQIANAFGGQTTPHAFLFDKDFNLVYKGAIDDNAQDAADVKKAYLKEAIGSLSGGEEIVVSETQPVGCGIKRKTD